jgi:hypothetical protein
MSKNVLIRNLTQEQSDRLLLIQKKFGVKTNTQALLQLLRYCVILDDELFTLAKMYENFAKEAHSAANEMDGQKLNSEAMKGFVQLALRKYFQLKLLLEKKK